VEEEDVRREDVGVRGAIALGLALTDQMLRALVVGLAGNDDLDRCYFRCWIK
jgi:hypothetical protein